MRLALALAALLTAAGLSAQTATSSAVQQVELLAPQLVGFSGSAANFESLVNGLTGATPVTLATAAAGGTLQIVTFAPGTTMTPAQAARTLESARQNLIARGIATPSAQQIAVALIGGTLTNGATSAALPGVLTGSATGAGVQVRNESVAVSPVAVRPVDSQAVRASLPPETVASLSAAQFDQALQLALGLLAQQGIFNPTPEQLRVALLGGTLVSATGLNVNVRGLLQGRVRNTSESRFFGTSNTRVLGTSNTPPSANPPPAPTPPAAAGATSPTGALIMPPAAARPPARLGASPGR